MSKVKYIANLMILPLHTLFPAINFFQGTQSPLCLKHKCQSKQNTFQICITFHSKFNDFYKSDQCSHAGHTEVQKKSGKIPGPFQAYLAVLVLAKDRDNSAVWSRVCVHVVILNHAHHCWGVEVRDPHFQEGEVWLVLEKKRWRMEIVPAILVFVSGLCYIDEHFPCKTPSLTYTVIRIVAGTVQFFYLIAVSTSFYTTHNLCLLHLPLEGEKIKRWGGRGTKLGTATTKP